MHAIFRIAFPAVAGTLPAVLLALSLAGCDVASVVPQSDRSIEDLVIADDFDYATTRTVDVSVRALTNSDEPLAGVVFRLYASHPDSADALLLEGRTGADGWLKVPLSLSAMVERLVVVTDYIGLPNRAEMPIVADRATHVFGGSAPQRSTSGAMSLNAVAPSGPLGVEGPSYQFLGGWDSQGVPSYLVDEPDYIDVAFLELVNAALPEQNPVPVSNPDYLAEGNDMDVRLVQAADVWVTFLHEGAGWKNSLAFYTYDLDAPPQSVADVPFVTVIFPNVSYRDSGGGLTSGQKVKVRLGSFPAGTGIGWALVANGWNGNGVGAGSHIVYSEPRFNPEPDPTLRQHSVLLHDTDRNLLLLSFEDMRRDNGSDNDFNDAIFYVTANPYSAIETENIVVADTPPSVDTGERTRVGTLFYPSSSTFGTLAFEDLWPGRGDYDFNDLVVDYRYELGLNSNNDIVEIHADYVVKAVGAGYRNGFGVEFPVSPNLISRVEGTRTGAAFTTIASNGLEAGQDRAVVIVFDDAYQVVQRPPGFFVNTQREAPSVAPETVRVTLIPARPLSLAEFGSPPYNPFLIANGQRGREIHLPDMPPTRKADPSFFGQSGDNSRPQSGRYYKTKNNLPWAIHLPVSFEYPLEQHAITTAHLEFSSWAESSGTSYTDWFVRKPNSRNPLLIY